jgi:2-hydroxyacyl-CoA lyase
VNSVNASSDLAERLKALPPEKMARLKDRTASGLASGNALVAEALWRCGIKRVFGIAGTPVDRIFSECAARAIRPIGTRHQQAAVLAAAAGNYVAGRLESAVVVSAGPAVTNTLTGILVARDNGWPVLVMGGRRPVNQESTGCFQELDALPIFSSVTKWAATPRRTGQIMDYIFQGFAEALTGRPGPVYLDLPEDVLEGKVQPSARSGPVLPPPVAIDAVKVESAARLVFEAKRPLLIVGDGLRWSLNVEALLHLVEIHGLPFITTSLGRGYLPDDHWLCANEVRRWIQSQADVVVMAGAWFDWRFRFGGELAPGTRVIHADAEPSKVGKNVTPTISVVGDAGQFLGRLADALDAPLTPVGSHRLSEWHSTMDKARKEKRRSLEPWLRRESSPLAPQQLFRAIRDFLPLDAIVALEGNVSLSSAQKILLVRRPASWLDPGWNGIIGGGIPFAIGAKLACPGRPVIALCGDTGFGMSAVDLETAARHEIPIVVVIANNDGNTGAERQKNFFPAGYPEKFTEFLPALRYERIMEVFGGHAEWVTEPEELRTALERAVASDRAACINVRVDPNAPHPGFW